MLGIRGVCAPFREEAGGLPAVAEIERLISPRTRAILLVTRATRRGWSPAETIHQLERLAAKHGIALVLDETYADFIPGGVRATHSLAVPAGGPLRPYHVIRQDLRPDRVSGRSAGCLGEVHPSPLKAQDTMAVCQPCVTQLAIKYGMENLEDW